VRVPDIELEIVMTHSRATFGTIRAKKQRSKPVAGVN